MSPLHIAVVLGNERIAELLLKAGADPSSQNRLGMTPLQLAVSYNKPKLAELLAKHGAMMQVQGVWVTSLSPPSQQLLGSSWLSDTGCIAFLWQRLQQALNKSSLV